MVSEIMDIVGVPLGMEMRLSPKKLVGDSATAQTPGSPLPPPTVPKSPERATKPEDLKVGIEKHFGLVFLHV